MGEPPSPTPLQPSAVSYMTSVAPEALTGTAISLMATVTWVVGRGAGSLLAGSLLAGLLADRLGVRGMFLLVAAGVIATTLAYWGIYQALLKRWV